MARKVSKAGKGGGDALAQITDILNEITESTDKTAFALSVNPGQKVFNTFSQDMKAELSKAYITAAGKIESQLGGAMLDNIETVMWPWPRATRRKNGDWAGSPRDIVDSQDLQDRNNIKVSYSIKGFKVVITNSAPYSGIIHYGGYVGGNLYGGRGTFIPGRPWIAYSLGVQPQRGRGAVALPSGGGGTVVDYKSIINDEVRAAIDRVAEKTAKDSK